MDYNPKAYGSEEFHNNLLKDERSLFLEDYNEVREELVCNCQDVVKVDYNEAQCDLENIHPYLDEVLVDCNEDLLEY